MPSEHNHGVVIEEPTHGQLSHACLVPELQVRSSISLINIKNTVENQRGL